MDKKIDLPLNNSDYKNVSYWNSRYENEREKDWLLSYEGLESILMHHVGKNYKILMLGCGNSLLSEMMFINGFHNITNIDYSSVVIENMSKHCENCSKMKWLTMDAQKLQFENEYFDIVIEKATIDSFLVGNKDQWTIPDETKKFVDTVLSEVSRVLKDKGKFLSVSFSQPHFRGPLYACTKFNWSFSKKELGTDFHYYVYIMTKGQALQSDIFFYSPPNITRLRNECSSSEPDEDNFLFSIEHET